MNPVWDSQTTAAVLYLVRCWCYHVINVYNDNMSAPPNIWTIIWTELLQITGLMKGDLVLLNLYLSPEFQV